MMPVTWPSNKVKLLPHAHIQFCMYINISVFLISSFLCSFTVDIFGHDYVHYLQRS